jgi:hypothetical protein
LKGFLAGARIWVENRRWISQKCAKMENLDLFGK